MGAFRDGEEPFRSSPLARRLLEGAGEQVVGRLLGAETVVMTTSGLRDAPGRAPAPP